MKALILNNKVVDTSAVEFEVHKSLVWMECSDECAIGQWELVGGILQAIPETEDTRTYSDFRRAAYPSLTDQADMAYWDRKNGTTTLDDAITAVKSAYPKT